MAPFHQLSWLARDGKLILAARIIRSFSYGFLSIILAIYLKLIGVNDGLIGFALTATLVNSVVLTLVASFYADRFARRNVLIVYAALMSVSGAIFLATQNYVALIAAALIGTINVTGTETGSFLSLEQAILPQTVTDDRKRNIAFAVYNMAGTFAMSGGILLAGLPAIFQQHVGITPVESIKPLFLLYSVLGAIVVAIYFMLTKQAELAAASEFLRLLKQKTSGPVDLEQWISPEVQAERMSKIIRIDVDQFDKSATRKATRGKGAAGLASKRISGELSALIASSQIAFNELFDEKDGVFVMKA
jgi:MFS family permease